MSADNYLYINKKTYEVWSCVASRISDDINDQKTVLVGKGKDLPDAIKIAEEYEQELMEKGLYVEYGIRFKLWYK